MDQQEKNVWEAIYETKTSKQKVSMDQKGKRLLKGSLQFTVGLYVKRESKNPGTHHSTKKVRFNCVPLCTARTSAFWVAGKLEDDWRSPEAVQAGLDEIR